MNAGDVRDNGEERRFEIWVDGQLAGFTTCGLRGDLISFLHTELKPEFQGAGTRPDTGNGSADLRS